MSLARPVPQPPRPLQRSASPVEVLTLTTSGDTREGVLVAARTHAQEWFGHDRVTMRNARVKSSHPHPSSQPQPQPAQGDCP